MSKQLAEEPGKIQVEQLRVQIDGDEKKMEETPEIRYAADERFKEAHRKTSTLHTGLFRRLAE